MDRRDSIVDATCATVIEVGIAQLTVGDVAKRAGISTALVHYHFRTKRALLAAACERLAARRTAARTKALAADGLAGLDALWTVLRTGSASAEERAWTDLALLARRDADVRRTLAAGRRAEAHALASRLPELLASLGAAVTALPEETAGLVSHFVDGVALALGAGAPPEDVRGAYDAFWLVLVTAGQPRRAR